VVLTRKTKQVTDVRKNLALWNLKSGLLRVWYMSSGEMKLISLGPTKYHYC